MALRAHTRAGGHSSRAATDRLRLHGARQNVRGSPRPAESCKRKELDMPGHQMNWVCEAARAWTPSGMRQRRTAARVEGPKA